MDTVAAPYISSNDTPRPPAAIGCSCCDDPAEVEVVHATNAVNRSFSDLDTTRFACATAVLCAARTAVQHPITLALTRKQTCGFAASMSTSQVITTIMRTEGGVRSLTQGMATMVAACALSEAFYLLLIEWLRESLPMEGSFGKDATSAYIGDASSRLIYLPLSIISFRQMTQTPFTASSASDAASASTLRKQAPVVPRASARQILKGMYAEGGLKSVFCGLGMTLMIGSQWSALWWATYLQLKNVSYAAASPFLRADRPDYKWNAFTSREDNVVINTCASMVTSATTSLIFNPFFVLRINMQLTPRATILGTARTLHARGGARVFFQGAYLNMVSATVDGVLASTSYEYAKLFADRSRPHAM